MKLYRKYILFIIVCFIMLLPCSLTNLNVKANSAQTYWSGVDAMGTIVTSDDCPLEVTKEVLTFDLLDFPNIYVDNEINYNGKVTAEYTFYNPTDLTINATLAFPFGTLPNYINQVDDTDKYDVLVNNKAVDKSIRYTYNIIDNSILEQLPKIQDTYITNDLFKPDTTVTEYYYEVKNMDDNGKVSLSFNVAFDYFKNNERIIIFSGQNGYSIQNNGSYRLNKFVKNNENISVIVIGKPLESNIDFKLYKNASVKDTEIINGTVSYQKKDTSTLEQFLLKNYNDEMDISKVDYYNSLLDYLMIKTKDYGFFTGDPRYYQANSNELFSYLLMRWYQYKIVIGPKETITNSVTAPIYPAINMDYNPTLYTYTYLLSPASTWASFNDLEIVINSPFYIINSSIDGFEKTENGYRLISDNLPDKELEFSLSVSEEVVKKKSSAFSMIVLASVYVVFGFFLLLISIAVIILIILIVLKAYKKKRSVKTGDN